MNKFTTLFIAILLFQTIYASADTQQNKEKVNGITLFKEARFKKNEITKPFYYIRHGETDVNKYGVIPENGDVPLNEEGIIQVQKAAKLLQGKNIKIIVVSPLLRAKQTAEIINKELNVPIIYHDGLKEGGEWKVPPGTNIKETSEDQKIWKGGGEVVGAENLYSFQARIHNTIKEVLNKYDNVLVVAHGRYFRYFTTLLNEEPMNSKNAIPYYFSPVLEGTGKKLYEIDSVSQTKNKHGRNGKSGLFRGEDGESGADAE